MPTTLKLVTSAGEAVVTAGRPFVVGRGKESDHVMSDRQVSRRHLVITCTNAEWTVRDVSSLGTWLDGQQVQDVAVQQGVRLRLGAPDGPEVALTPVPSNVPAQQRVPAAAPDGQPARQAPSPSPSGVSPVRPASPEVPQPARQPPSNARKPPVQPARPPEPPVQPRAHEPLADPNSGAETIFPGSPEYARDQQRRQTATANGVRLEREHGRRNTYPLRRGVMTIGRSQHNDIVVEDLLASRQHAEIFVGQSGIQVVDLDSANGTFINGRKVSRGAVGQRDIIAVGHHLFQLENDELVEYLDSGNISFEADGLNVFVKDNLQIMHDVSFRLPGRALLAVIGPSGSGKSTLLNALTGFRPADGGTVRYAGRDMYAEYSELRRRIGHVPQDDLLHTTLTVRKALEYGARLRFPPDTTKRERAERIDEVLRELGLEQRADVPVQNLSGGQRKRTSVALELLTRPTLLFLDEPTSGLDPGLDKNVMAGLRKLADDGRTIVVVTHSVAQLHICDYILVLAKGGRIAYFGPPKDALQFLGKESWPDVFEMLEEAPPAELAERFRASSFYVPASVTAPPARPEPRALASVRQQSVLSQILTLSRRQWSVIVSDRTYLLLIVLFPFMLGALPRFGPLKNGLNELPNGIPNIDASGQLNVIILCACFMGMANSIREIVKERAIYRRERTIGLSLIAYLGSKILVLSFITLLQSTVFSVIGMYNRTPRDAVLLPSPMLEGILAVAVVSLSSAMLGLAISAWVDNADKTMPLLVITTMTQIIFSGGIFPLQGMHPIQEIAYLLPARWGYAALASAADFNVVTQLGTGPFSRGPADSLWEHTAQVYLTDIVGCVAVGFLAVIVCVFLLRRLDPKAGARRGGMGTKK